MARLAVPLLLQEVRLLMVWVLLALRLVPMLVLQLLALRLLALQQAVRHAACLSLTQGLSPRTRAMLAVASALCCQGHLHSRLSGFLLDVRKFHQSKRHAAMHRLLRSSRGIYFEPLDHKLTF